MRLLLWRRSLVLVVVGFLHCVLLYAGDILAAYGVLLFFGAWAVRWKDRWLLIVAAFFFLLGSLPGGGSSTISTDPPDISMLPPDLLTQLGERALVSPFIAVVGPIGFACAFLVGLWGGRRRVLEEPEPASPAVAGHGHRRDRCGGAGCPAGGADAVGGLVMPGEDTLQLIGPLHDSTGVLGGFGYAALIALIAQRIGSQRGRAATAISAVGQRSMTCYLAQSVVWAVVFTPWLLDLSDELTVATTALLALATWLATIVLADRMRRAGYRGPFELLVRRVTYRQPAR